MTAPASLTFSRFLALTVASLLPDLRLSTVPTLREAPHFSHVPWAGGLP